jgi:hypothetical protein
MCNKCHTCFVSVEAEIGATGTTKLPNLQRLAKGNVRSILVRKSGSGTLKSLSGKTLAPDSVVNTAHLTLKNANGYEIFSAMPMSVLQRDNNSPEPLCVNLEGGLDMEQSFIRFDTSGSTATHVFEVIFGLECDC